MVHKRQIASVTVVNNKKMATPITGGRRRMPARVHSVEDQALDIVAQEVRHISISYYYLNLNLICHCVLNYIIHIPVTCWL